MRTAKTSALIFVVMLLSTAGWAATNFIMVGGGSTQPNPASHRSIAPWQVQGVVGVVMALGLVHMLFPRVGWWFKYGWQFRDAPEPSGLWLFFARLGGLLIVVVTGLFLCRMNGIDFGLPIPK